jgi:hypothetical protein
VFDFRTLVAVVGLVLRLLALFLIIGSTYLCHATGSEKNYNVSGRRSWNLCLCQL